MALKEHYAGEIEFIVADIDTPESKELLKLEQFDAPYIPIFYFLDGDGNTVSAEAGVFSFDEMEEWINQVLGE